jgi:hypothetical protein
VKYLAIVYLLPPVAVYLAITALAKAKFEGWKRQGRNMILLTFFMTIAFLPWAIKNTLLVGNPVYPLFHTYFPSTEYMTDAAEEFHMRHGWIGLKALSDPWPTVRNSLASVTSEGYTTTILLPFAVGYAVWRLRSNRVFLSFCVLFSIWYLGAMLLFGFHHRLYVSSLPIGSLLAGWFLDSLFEKIKRIRWIEPLAVAWLGFATFYFQFLLPHYLYPVDQWYRGSFFQIPPLLPSKREHLPSMWMEARKVVTDLNSLLDKNSYLYIDHIPDTLSLEFRRLTIPFFPNPFLGSPYFGANLREIGISHIGANKVAADPEMLHEWFKKQGITHLLLGDTSDSLYPFNKKKIGAWDRLTLYAI